MSTRPTINLNGIKPGNLFHLVNRSAKALTESGRSSDAVDLKDRTLNGNVKLSFDETLAIVREYVDIEASGGSAAANCPV